MSIRYSVLLVSSLLAVGCGGDSDDDDGDGGPTGNAATLEGTAAKGIIIGGQVLAEEMDSSGTAIRSVGTAVTDGSGEYQLELSDSYAGGPIKITVSTDSNTVTVCDAPSGCGNFVGGASGNEVDNNGNNVIDFGDRYAPASLSMSALIADAEEDEVISVQVTPFTNMAADRALGAGTLNATAIVEANSEVSNLLGGVDILSTPPVDLTDEDSVDEGSPVAVAYASLLASVAELADDDANGQPDIDDALSDLSTEFSSGTFSADTMQEILDEAQAALDEANIGNDTSFVLASIQDDVNAAGSGGSLDPEASENAGDSNVELAKAFFDDLGTWGTVISAEAEAPSQAFEQQLDMADAVWDFVGDATGAGLAAAVSAIVDRLDGVIAADGSLAGYSNEEGSFTSGSISTTSVTNGVEYTVTNAAVTTDEGNATVSMTAIIPADGETVSSLVIGIQSASAEDAAQVATINAGTVTIAFVSGQTLLVDYEATDLEVPEIESMEFDLDVSFTDKLTVENGQVVTASDPLTYAGDMEFTLYPVTDPNGEIVGAIPGLASFDGSVSDSADSLELALTMSLPGASTLEPENTILALDSSYADNNNGDRLSYWEYSNENNTFTYYGPYTTQSITYNPGDRSVDIYASYEYDGYVYIDEYNDSGPYTGLADASQYYSVVDYGDRKWVEGQGEYERDSSVIPDYTMDGFVPFYLVEADVEVNLDSEEFDVGLQFTAQFDGTPEAVITITGEQTAFETGTATVTISYGTRSLVFSAEAVSGVASGDLTITNSDGVELVMSAEDGDESGAVTINNVVVAEISEINDGFLRVDYIDGTFEIY